MHANFSHLLYTCILHQNPEMSKKSTPAVTTDAFIKIPKNTMLALQEAESPASSASSTPQQKTRIREAKEYIDKWQKVAYADHTDPKH